MAGFTIRNATVDDTNAINEIANWYIENSAVNFDTESWSLDKRREWVVSFNQEETPYKILVGENDGEIIGFACNTRFKPKGAYNTSTESTVYIAHHVKSEGRGEKLYSALLELIAEENIHRAYAFITLPNDPSVALHERLGFKRIGVFDEIGKKFGKYHDGVMYQKDF